MVKGSEKISGFLRRLAGAPEAVAGRPAGRPLPGRTELPRAARRTLRRHRSRAGALARLQFDHAAAPPKPVIDISERSGSSFAASAPTRSSFSPAGVPKTSTSTVIGKQLPDLPHASGIDVVMPLVRPTLARSCHRHGVLSAAAGCCNAVSSRDVSSDRAGIFFCCRRAAATSALRRALCAPHGTSSMVPCGR